MKRILISLLAPLLVAVLSAFSVPHFSMEQQTKSKDSTMVNVRFSPAQIVVNDNRTVGILQEIVKENSKSNNQVAIAINNVAEVMSKNLNLQERRCASVMDRITQQTGLPIKEVERILHKKRIYDITSYTLFLVVILYFLYSVSSFSGYFNIISLKEWSLKMISAILYLGLLYLFYLCLGEIVLGKYYPLIQTIINSSS